MSIDDGQEINERKLNKIKFEILKLEDENAKTKNYDRNEMVELIKEKIKDGVDGKLN